MTTKKIILMLAAFLTAILCNTFVFAADENVIRDAGSSISNVAHDAGSTIKNGVEDATAGIKNGIENIGNNVKNGAENIGNTMENGLDRATGSINNNNNNYTATRTNTQYGAFMGMGPIAWTWFSLALAGIIIVALVWYYGTQNKNRSSHYNND